MAESKTLTYPPQEITQIFDGTTLHGPIDGSGGYSRIDYFNHDISNLGVGDCGGPMILNRQRVYHVPGTCSLPRAAGSQVALRPSWTAHTDQTLASTLWGKGATAIARCTPTNPGVNVVDVLAQDIQIREAIPKALGSSIWRDKVLNFKSLGKEYLNVEFGWLPFVDDIKSVAYAVKHSHDIVNTLSSGSDKKTRVGYKFSQTPTTVYDDRSAFLYSLQGTISGWDAGPVTHFAETGHDIWFKGCFNYHIPPPGNSDWDKFTNYADHVLGIRPTLEAVWDAAPWSWMVDWAVNVGDIARNISNFAQDGLILQYGYIMCHDYARETYSAPGLAGNCSATAVTRVEEWKSRFQADPYGFGLTYDGLSDTQKAILASIGITHF